MRRYLPLIAILLALFVGNPDRRTYARWRVERDGFDAAGSLGTVDFLARYTPRYNIGIGSIFLSARVYEVRAGVALGVLGCFVPLLDVPLPR